MDRKTDKAIEMETKDLSAIEENINKAVREMQNTKRRLFILLAQIKVDRLYEQAGFGSFKEYVTSKRLKISYNTALEYSRMGEILLKYKEQLERVDFCEEDGFKKLLFLDQALNNHKPEEVFKKIKEDSFKSFSRYSKPARAGFASSVLKRKDQTNGPTREPEKWIFEENGKLFLNDNTPGAELLTFNKQLLEDENLSGEYKAFMANIIIVAMDHFKRSDKKREVCK